MGLLSVVALMCGSFPIFVESRIVVPGDAAATAFNILASESLFRLGIVSMLLMNAVYLFAVLGWYRLLEPVSIFAGLWLFPLGLLVFRSGYLPRALGVLLMIGCFGYLIRFFQGFLFPGHEATIWTNPFVVVAHVAELTMMVWLLIKGVDVGAWKRRAAVHGR